MGIMSYFAIPWWVVLSSVAAHFIVGSLWFGPFFGKSWMKANSLSDKDVAGGNGSVFLTAIITVIMVTFGLAFVLNAIGVETIAHGLVVTFIVWAGLSLAPYVNHLGFERRPKSLIGITSLYDLVAWLLTSILIVVS